jgi:trypsin
MKTSLKGFSLLMRYRAYATPPHHPYPYPPIVKGIMISISQAPYQVLLNSGANGGGAIIADRWILTAAHLSNVTGGKAGVSTRSQTGQALQIANFYFPNNFDEQLTGQIINYNSTSNPAHDIALIKLAQPLSISGNTTGYAQLASSQNQSLWNPGQLAFVSGYGRTSINASLSEELRRVNVSIISGGAAERKIHVQGPNNNDACEGDSGGPLVSNNILIGTVSSDLGGVSSQPSCGYRVSPNPAQKQLSVDFDAPDHPESIPDLVELNGETSTKPLRSVELSRQKAGGQVASSLTMDVGDLPRGVYYLHLTFGANQERVRVILN